MNEQEMKEISDKVEAIYAEEAQKNRTEDIVNKMKEWPPEWADMDD